MTWGRMTNEEKAKFFPRRKVTKAVQKTHTTVKMTTRSTRATVRRVWEVTLECGHGDYLPVRGKLPPKEAFCEHSVCRHEKLMERVRGMEMEREAKKAKGAR